MMNYVVINTCVIIDLIDMYKSKNKTPSTPKEEKLFKLKHLIETREITPIATPTIIREISHGSKYDRGFGEIYLQAYFYEPDFDDYMNAKTLLLADGYGNYEIGDEEDNHPIPEAEDYLSRNYNNAKIIGEVSVLEKKMGKTIPFITYNTMHTFNFRNINFINFRNNMPETRIHTLKGLDNAVLIAKSNNENTSE